MRRVWYWFIILALFVLFIIITFGCSKRKNPERAIIPPEGTVMTMWISSDNLENNAYGDPSGRIFYVYFPPNCGEGGRRYPVLYLLHGYGESFYYYDKIHNISKISDRLIARKEIQPMLIVMPDGSNLFGGSYYTNSEILTKEVIYSDFGGRYEDYIAKELRSFIDSLLFVRGKLKPSSTLEDTIYYKTHRAISGYDMGGYGALKIAMKYPGLFGSVSALSPYPVYFTLGEKDTLIDGESRFRVPQEWINTIFFEENGFDSLGDTSSYYHMYEKLQEEGIFKMPHTARLFAMASAFSPHPGVRVAEPETVSTFFKRSFEGALGIDLPMDDSAKTMFFAWNHLWRKHDLKVILDSLFEDENMNPFEETRLYLDCGNQDQFALAQTRAFHLFLSEKEVDHLYDEYSGYGDFFAGSDNFLYDRLEKVLKFHSEIFPKPENEAPEIVAIEPQEVVVDSTLKVEVTATDPDDDSLVLTAEFLTFNLEPIEEWPPNAEFTDFGNGEGLLSFIPDTSQIGIFRVKFKASDGRLWDEEVVSIRVKEE